MAKPFPSIGFGKCTHCNGGAADNGGTSADVESRSDDIGGLGLVWWRGEWWCPNCITTEKSKEYTEKTNYFRAREDSFRAQAGFVDTIS